MCTEYSSEWPVPKVQKVKWRRISIYQLINLVIFQATIKYYTSKYGIPELASKYYGFVPAAAGGGSLPVLGPEKWVLNL